MPTPTVTTAPVASLATLLSGSAASGDTFGAAMSAAFDDETTAQPATVAAAGASSRATETAPAVPAVPGTSNEVAASRALAGLQSSTTTAPPAAAVTAAVTAASLTPTLARPTTTPPAAPADPHPTAPAAPLAEVHDAAPQPTAVTGQSGQAGPTASPAAPPAPTRQATEQTAPPEKAASSKSASSEPAHPHSGGASPAVATQATPSQAPTDPTLAATAVTAQAVAIAPQTPAPRDAPADEKSAPATRPVKDVRPAESTATSTSSTSTDPVQQALIQPVTFSGAGTQDRKQGSQPDQAVGAAASTKTTKVPAAPLSEPTSAVVTSPVPTPLRADQVTAPTATTATTPTAPSVPADVAASVRKQLAGPVIQIAHNSDGDQVMVVKVRPDNLGPVTVQAHVSDSGHVHVELFAPSAEGRSALQQISSDLRSDLSSSGAGNTSLNVSSETGPPADRDGQPREETANKPQDGNRRFDSDTTGQDARNNTPRGSNRLLDVLA